MTETRQKHLEWCKKRANEYIDRGDLNQAFASMASDMGKHPGTVGHEGLILGAGLMMRGDLKTEESLRRFIDGFN